ncbi:MAG: cyclic nucleotide-binding domain-containing protein [Bacteroidota bacterium]
MQNGDIISTLEKSGLFAGLKQDALEFIARKTKVRQFFPNDVIVWQGQPSKTLFFIRNGIVAVKSMTKGKENILAYLVSGNTFGEVGILENQPRSASVVAVSEVDVLVIQREDFLDILHRHSTVAVELARTLGHYLIQSNRRLLNENHRDLKMILLFNAQDETGSTTLGTLLAKELFDTWKSSTAYLEYPNPYRIMKGEQLPKGKTVFNHEDGYDILFPIRDEHLPFATQTTLLLDRITQQYSNIVVNIHGGIDEATQSMLEDATQVLVLSGGSEKGIKDAQYILKQLKLNIRVEDTSVFTVLSQNDPSNNMEEMESFADYVVPFLQNYPTFYLQQSIQHYPAEMRQIVSTCVDRLDRTNSIGVYIPSTMDANQYIDTTHYKEKTLNFMAERFGGATCKTGTGVWNSEQLGLIGESVYIIHSYITQTDLNRHLDEVLDYIRGLKKELRQEAMALEINRKLTLI